MPLPQPLIGQIQTGKFLKKFPTPQNDVYLYGRLSSNIANYVQTFYGTPPPLNTNPDHMLVNEVPVDWETVLRLFVADPVQEDTYNYSITYGEDAPDYPIYIRDYWVRRSTYSPLTNGTTLAGLYVAKVTNGGSGYSQATVSVSLTGGTGSGGVITAIVSNGVVTNLVITAEGNYSVAPTITITGGTGATGTAFVQPASAVLVKEEALRQSDSELDGLYFLVRRTYKTLPGFPKVSTSPGEDGKTVTTTRTEKKVLDIVTGETLIGTTWTWTTMEAIPGVSYYAIENVVVREVPGNVMPATEWRSGIAVETTWQFVPLSSITSTVGIFGSTWVRTYGHPVEGSDLVGKQMVETWPLSGPLVPETEWRSGIAVAVTHQLIKTADAVTTRAIVGSDWLVKFTKSFEEAEDVVLQVIETWPLNGPLVPETDWRNGIGVIITRQLLKSSDAVTTRSLSGSNWIVKSQKQFDDSTDVSFQIIESWPLSGPSVPATEYRRGIAVTITNQLIKSSDVVTSRAIVSSSWVVKTQKDFDDSTDVCFQIIETWPLSGPSVVQVAKQEGILVSTTNQLIKVSDVVLDAGSMDVGNTHWIVKLRDPFDDSEEVCFQVTQSWPISGPLVPETDWKAGAEVTTTVQLLKSSNVVTTHAIVGSAWVVKRQKQFDSATAVAFQLIDTWTLPGQVSTETEVREGTTVTITSQLIDSSTAVTGESAVGGNRVKKYTKPFEDSADVCLQIIETWTLAGTAIPEKNLHEYDADVVSVTRQLMLISAITSSLGETVVSSVTWQKVTQKPFEDSTIMAFRVVETRTVPGGFLNDTRLDPDGVSVTIGKALVVASTLSGAGETIGGSQYQRTYQERVPGSHVIAFQIKETRISNPGPVLLKTEEDQATGSLVLVTRQFVDNTDPIPDWTATSNTYREPYPNSSIAAWNITRTYIADLTNDLTADTRIDQADGAVITMNRLKIEVAALIPGDYFSGSTWTRISKVNIFPDGGQRSLPQSYPVDLTTLKTEYLVETRPLPGPLLSGETVDPATGIVFPFTKRLVPTGTVTAGITGAGVITLTILNPGSGFTGNPTITIAAPPSGTTATATATYAAPGVAGAIGSLTLVNGGAGFTLAPTLAISGGGGSGATATATLRGTTVLTLTVATTNASFTDVPAVAITGGAGAGATGIALLTHTTVASVTIDAGGTGYTGATCTFAAPVDQNGNLIPGGVAATGTVSLSGTAVSSISVTGAGSGYINRPTVIISGDGTGATAHAVLTGTSLASLVLTGTGADYTTPPAVTITGGGGAATATSGLAPTTIASVALGSAGSGYTAPVVALSGGGGSGASVTAALVSGVLSTVTITLNGTGYLVAPVVTVSGGAGSGAIVAATIGSSTYITVQPINTVVDMVDSNTVDLSTLPAPRVMPCSFRVQRTTISRASIVMFVGQVNTSSALQENTLVGGSGPVLALKREQYMTDSQFAAYDPGAFSVTGRSLHGTMIAVDQSVSGDNVYINAHTFQRSSRTEGTSAGVLDVSDEKLKYGLRKVTTIYTTVAY